MTETISSGPNAYSGQYTVSLIDNLCTVTDTQSGSTSELDNVLAAWLEDSGALHVVLMSEPGGLSLLHTNVSNTSAHDTGRSCSLLDGSVLAVLRPVYSTDGFEVTTVVIMRIGVVETAPPTLKSPVSIFHVAAAPGKRSAAIATRDLQLYMWHHSENHIERFAKLGPAGFVSIVESLVDWSPDGKWLMNNALGFRPMGTAPAPSAEERDAWLWDHRDSTTHSICILDAASSEIVVRFILDDYYAHDWLNGKCIIYCVSVYGNDRVPKRKYIIDPESGKVDVDNMIEYITE